MTRWTISFSLLALGMGLATAGGRESAAPATEPTNPHAYFDALVKRADHWKSYSLREQAQLGATNRWVTYSPATDPDPQAQDAAKVVIPAFSDWQTEVLAASVGPGELELRLSDAKGDVTKVNTAINVRGMIIKVGDEYMTAVGGGSGSAYPLTRSTGVYRLASRGSLGSTPRSHPAGTRVQWANNNLRQQVRLPIGTQDGYSYLITWDGYWTNSYVRSGLNNHKTFQLSTGSRQRIWLEPQTFFASSLIDPDVHVASIGHARYYGGLDGGENWATQNDGRQAGPGVTGITPLRPQQTSSIPLHPGRWARWWVYIDQRASGYDIMSMWVAEEQTDPVLMYDRLPLSVPPQDDSTIGHFWLEFNTSTDQYRGDMRDLVAYVRNVVVLRNPHGDVTSLLVRPGDTPGHHISSGFPAAPRNLRTTGSPSS